MEKIRVYTNDMLVKLEDGSFKYSDSYGESWEFETGEDFKYWADDEGIVLDDSVIEFIS